MSSDDDDWVGTPPEGRYSRDRAKPDFWAKQYLGQVITGGVLLLVVVIVVVILVTR
jgi:hypothetical protein